MKKMFILVSALIYLTGCSTVEIKNSAKMPSTQEEKVFQNKKYEVLDVYNHEIKKEIKFSPKYSKNSKILNYVLIKTETGNIREFPSIESKIIEKRNFNEKFKVLKKVKYQENIWYKVELQGGREGFISDQIVEYRGFRFNEALKKLEGAVDFVKNGNHLGKEIAIVDSYSPDPNSKNQKRDRDKYGTTEDQSLVGVNPHGEKIFIPDRSIVEVMGKNEGKAKIRVSSITEEYIMVNEKNISFTRKLSENSINKAVVVDIANQNKMIFEKINGEWNMISYVYSKTGFESELGYETPRGHFIAAVSKSRMYYNDALGKEQGYAKDATRFSGGGYLHSTPLDNSEQGDRKYNLAQKELTLGTYPGTRKCVRTTEEHAKFIREWVMGDSFNPKLEEQVIKDNVLFVVM